MKYIRPAIRGACIAVMAGAVGLDSFSAEWWLFLVAASVAITLGRAPDAQKGAA